MSKAILCVNIDHIATIREARGGVEPDLLEGARICEASGAAGITVHLREDRRHIQDKDVFALKKIVKGKFNLEMALSDDIIRVARKVVPDQVTIVPEKREELTTEGGLDVKGHAAKIREVVKIFHGIGTVISLFVEPDKESVEISRETGADFIEIHTGSYCNAVSKAKIKKEADRIYKAAESGMQAGIRINAGHGLNYQNVQAVLKTPGLEELNIGHSIISRAVFTGLSKAVREMADIINGG